MKKIFLSFAVAVLTVAGISSCSSTAKNETEDEGAALKAKIENCTDADSLRVYVEQAQAYVLKLQEEGKAEEAVAYLNEVAPVIEEKDPTVASYFQELKSKAEEGVNEAVEEAKDAVVEAGEAVVDSAKNKAAEVVETAKEAGKAAVETAANNAVEKGKEAVSNAAQKGADKVKDLIKK